jgi:photosystem II stability/assembly factor-like uncharacterized protein
LLEIISMINKKLRNIGLAILLVINTCNYLLAQSRIQSFKQLKSIEALNTITFKNVGPTVMSGRVTALSVNPNNTKEFYVGYASGGVFYSADNGLSFTPVFDKEASITIGDIAVDWSSKIIYVGTGECNSSRSSYAGTGMYKSIDSGKTWQHLGLENTQHIAKIIIDASNNKRLLVASMGPLYSSNKSATGLFETKDGGNTWQQINMDGNNTGVIDIIQCPSNPKRWYAATWQRTRQAWQFTGQGVHSKLYKSDNNGATWQAISGTNGIESNNGIGRIGIAVSSTNADVVYTLLDNQNRQAANKLNTKKLSALQLKEMSKDKFDKLTDEDLNSYLKNYGYPSKYKAEQIRKDVNNKKYTIAAIADWVLNDGDAALFETPVIGGELYKSINGGSTWQKTHTTQLDGLYFTYGYYFGTITLNPNNDNDVYIAGYPLLRSTDGGATFTEIGKDNCHPDYHRIWINPQDTNHIVVGNDGGVNITYTSGKVWQKCNSPSVGQFYAIATDNETPYNVYGGLQDNGTWYGPSTYQANTEWHASGSYPYKNVGGGDGMQVQIDNRNSDIIFTGYQFGNYQCLNKSTGSTKHEIHPTYDIGELPLRYNWQSPILLSTHQQDIFYIGSNYLHRSFNQGKLCNKMDTELAPTTRKGNVPYGTLTSISESQKQFGLLYCGTDNGLLWHSNDAGNTFNKINCSDKELWVSRVLASKHSTHKVWACLNGYRWDDFNPYLYMSNNNGKQWQKLGNNLPQEPINVIAEDPLKSNIIYIGTDNGLYISFDTGSHFIAWQSNLPRVAIHDIKIQDRDNEIVLGTHGRSIYIASLADVQLYDSIKNVPLYCYPINKVNYNKNWGNKPNAYTKANEPEIAIQYYSMQKGIGTITIKNSKQKIVYSNTLNSIVGFNTITYNGTINKDARQEALQYLSKGMYTVIITQQANTAQRTLEIK